MIGALLSEVCWGRWDDAAQRPDDCEGKRAAAATWRLEVGPTIEPQCGLLTYAVLLEEVLEMEKSERQVLKNTFADPGHPGESVRATYDALQAELRLPEGLTLPGALASVGEGRHFLLPSFLRCVLRLEEEKRDFRIVFRTFGTDIADVISEFNLFCSGNHPCFPGVPPQMSHRIVNLPHDSGEFYRDDAGFHLSMCNRVKGGVELVQQVHGLAECTSALNAKLFGEPKTLSLALRDYYPFWKKSKEADDSGKPLFVEAPKAGAAHHIFFDDNIERDRAHIVDARNAASGEPLPFSETQGVYLVKAEPLLAIKDPDYFSKALAAAEAELARRITAASDA